MIAATELAQEVGVKPACAALGVSRATFYRCRGSNTTGPQQPRPTPARALSSSERDEVHALLCSERFVDRSPAEVFATLLDEGKYLCSERTMYRILAERAEVRDRRNQLRHPPYREPELVASAPNEVWSWDITRLLGPTARVHAPPASPSGPRRPRVVPPVCTPRQPTRAAPPSPPANPSCPRTS